MAVDYNKNKTLDEQAAQSRKSFELRRLLIQLREQVSGRHQLVRILVFLLYAVLLPIPLITRDYYLIRVGGSVGIYLMLAAGLSIVAGQAGLLDLGYVGFYAIGAYTYALLASPKFGIHLPFLVAASLGILAAVIAALAVSIPTLRLHGDYLAMVTLGFGQIVRILLNNMDRPINITNGPNGLVAIDPPRIFGYTFASLESQYVLIWLFAIAVLIGVSRLAGSKIGRAWNALRENDTAAACMGVNVKGYRIAAFVGAAAIAGLAGALFASWQRAVFPQNFTMTETITLYCMIVLGGVRSVPGIMLGVLLLQVLPEALRAYSIYRMLIYGFALTLLAIFRPQGLVGVGEKLIGVNPRKVAAAKSSPDIPGDGADSDMKDGSAAHRLPAQLDSSTAPAHVPALELEGLTCTFGGLTALSNVTLTVQQGEILGIIGPNGAGKTTLFNLVTGLIQPISGDIRLYGESIVGKAPHEVALLGAARTFQNIRLYETQSVLENVLAGCHLRHRALLPEVLFRSKSHLRKEAETIGYVRSVLDQVECGLAERETVQVAELSYPDKRRVEMARALATGAKLILLDEPAAGMTGEEIAMLAEEIVLLKQQGYTVVVIEHHMDLITAACERVVVLNYGEKIAEGKPQEVAKNPEVIKAYFGSSLTPSDNGAAGSLSAVDGVLSPKAGTAAGESAAAILSACEDLDAASRPLLKLVNVHAGYGPAKVLQGIDLCVYPGEAVALLGLNAAGKSTTLKTITGRLRPTQGEIYFLDQRIDGRPTYEIVRMGMGVVPEGRRILPELTVMENLDLAADSLPKTQAMAGIEHAFALFPVLAERRSQLAGTLSGGEQQMLAIARALVTSPKLICMDEPSMGLAPIMVERVISAILEINKSGTAVLLVEQNASAALSIADRAYVLRDGKIAAAAAAEQMLLEDLQLM